jgi:glycosyltransferase involved in cell wall biosynthesis
MLSSLLALSLVKRAEIIFAMNPSFFAFYPALIYSMFTRKRIVRNVDDLWPEVFYDMGIVKSSLFRRLLDKVSYLSYRIPKIIVPVSNGYIRTLTDKYKVPKEKIHVIEHGVDITKFKRNVLSLDSKLKKVAMYSGNISEAYDLELVVHTAQILCNEPILFIIRGTGPDTQKIRSMIDTYGLSNIEIKTDVLSQQDLVSFMNSADIFLLPMNLSPFGATADMGLPTKTLEYQALGKPIICVSKGEAARYVIKTKSGLVISKRDPKELAALLLLLMNDVNLSEILGKNGLENITNNLTLEAIGKRFTAVIFKAIQ